MRMIFFCLLPAISVGWMLGTLVKECSDWYWFVPVTVAWGAICGSLYTRWERNRA